MSETLGPFLAVPAVAGYMLVMAIPRHDAASGPLPRKAHHTGKSAVFSLDKIEVFVYGNEWVYY